MAGKCKFEEEITLLENLREQPEQVRPERLRKALAHRNNFIVAKAADLAREFRMAELTDDLLSSFDHFFENPVKSDPQCWAKNALSRTLAALEYQDSEVFLRGMKHIQMEPVWGGRSDTAGTLRGTCALALVQCRSLSENELLSYLLELFGDKDKAVRAEAVRAIEQVGSPAATLLLRLRAVLGRDEPEVLGACYGGILRIEGVRAIRWMQRFMETGDDSAAEAALAIAGTHTAEAFEVLREYFVKAADPWWRSVLLSAIPLTRQPEAIEFLLELVSTESLDAEGAIAAILRSIPSQDVIQRLEKLVALNTRLKRVFTEYQKTSS
jgi:HEAT repeat protein